MTRLFITGGSGYIGRNLIRDAISRGWEVTALVRSMAAAQCVESLGAIPAKGSVEDLHLTSMMQGCDILIHAAADTAHADGSSNQDRVNVDGTRNVFSSAKRAGLRRALQISTEAVLLNGQPLLDANEEHPYPKHPAGAYSKTKGAAEQIALSFDELSFEVIIVRPRFVWGHDDTSALPQLMDAARTGKLAWIGDGHYPCSTTHIANLCHGVSLALEKGKAGEIYFIADEQPVDFRDFVTALLKSQGVEAPLKKVPRWLIKVVARLGDASSKLTLGTIRAPISFQEYATLGVPVTVSIAKAKAHLDYSPVVSLEQGLAQMEIFHDK